MSGPSISCSDLPDIVERLTCDIVAIEQLRTELLQVLSTDDVDEVIKMCKMSIAFRRSAAKNPSSTPAPPEAASAQVQAPRLQGITGAIPRPDFFPNLVDAPRQLDIAPEKWGIRYSQFRRLVRYFRKQPIYKAIKKQKGYVNLYDLNTYAIEPWTRDTPCSIALLFNPKGVLVNFMISHAWGEDIDELDDALDAFISDQELAQQDPVIWLCWLAVYQGKAACPLALGPSLEEQLRHEPFERVIRTREGGSLQALVAVHTTCEDLYKRLWCSKELFEAVTKRVHISIAASSKYRAAFVDAFQYWRRMTSSDDEAIQLWAQAGSSEQGISLSVNTSTAKCSSAVDEARIRREIESSKGGFKHLDDVILHFRKKSVIEVMKKRASTKDLKDAGYSLSDLKGAGYSDRAVLNAGYPAAALRSAGHTAEALKDAGYHAEELRRGGYTVEELRTVGHTVTELKHGGYTFKELHNAQCSVAELRAAGYTAWELHSAEYSAAELKSAGYTAKELRSAQYPVMDLKVAGYAAYELHIAEYMVAELKRGGYTAEEIRSASFSAAELKNGGYTVKELREAQHPATELKSRGYTAKELRNGGYTAEELRSAQYSTSELVHCGYTPKEFCDAKFSPAELRNLGCSATELWVRGCSAEELRVAGYPASELRRGGYSAEELRGTKYSATELKDAGYIIKEFRDAQWPASELRSRGFSAKELRIAGYSAKALRRLGSAQRQTLSDTAQDVFHSGGAVQLDPQ